MDTRERSLPIGRSEFALHEQNKHDIKLLNVYKNSTGIITVLSEQLFAI